ncbi:peroxynitrite isomerase THAP4-like [Ptychodera flava]|uniref:peroxynitrite isomerase THAP4-like n=1 Tax=Ptychodera flava TaxID=63121 RepID=UPI003969D4AC
MTEVPMHDFIKPLSWLLGRWQSETATGMYPTIQTFQYNDVIEFSHVGQPMLNFSVKASMDGKPLHKESGYLRIKPGTSQVAYLASHNFGIVEISEGTLDNSTIHLESHTIGRISFASEPAVLKIVRDIKLVAPDEIEQEVAMETSKTPLTKHLSIKYKKIAADK